MHGVKLAGVELDRKVLSDLAIREPEAFAAIVGTVKTALSRTGRAWNEPAFCPLTDIQQTGQLLFPDR